MQTLRIISFICLLIAAYYFVYYIYFGIANPTPGLGDSWDYHIPIAKSFLDGSFLNPNLPQQHKLYFPGSSEIFLTFFILFNIPMTLSNIFAIGVLGIVCYKLAKTFKLSSYNALIFSTTIVTLNATSRWMNAISIDVWVAIFFCLLIMFLEKPKNLFLYFLKLGAVCGMLVGSKYNSLLFIAIPTLIYAKNLIKIITIPRIFIFLIPFSVLGVFWYIRNYLAIGNPFYPMALFGFPGIENYGGYVSGHSMLNIGLQYPLDMLNSAFGEYKLWITSIVVAAYQLFYSIFIKKDFRFNSTTKILLIGVISFLFFLNFPTEKHAWIMVSSFRYSYPVFISLILGVFLIAQKYNHSHTLGVIAIANMINTMTWAYYPKLILIYLPLALILFYFFDKNVKTAHINK